MLKASIQLEPLTCPSCIKNIEGTLNKTVGVESVMVMFNSSKVKIEMDETRVDLSKVIETITKLGYSILSSRVF